ncbi:MAG: hypothetical protein GY799_21580 [Desulfobulbaceae bacterium]|nr:hypothetical protein [Desulfobulbaceae bacterium]
MSTHDRPNDTLLQEQLRQLELQLDEDRQNLEIPSDEINFQEYYYTIFENALVAAGIACLLKKNGEKIKTLLSTVTTAVVEVCRRKGTAVSRITHLPEEQEEIFTDDSLTNPWTVVQGVYAALISGSISAADEIISFDYGLDEVEHLIVSPLVEKYVSALKQVVKLASKEAAREIEELLSRWGKSSDTGERFWTYQAMVLRQINKQDEAVFWQTLDELATALEAYYVEEGLQDDPECALALPVRGLKALALHQGVISS